MFVKPDEDTTAAMARLARSAEWPKIEDWVKRSREACVKASLSADEVQCRKSQGALQAMDDMLEKITRAPELAGRR